MKIVKCFTISVLINVITIPIIVAENADTAFTKKDSNSYIFTTELTVGPLTAKKDCSELKNIFQKTNHPACKRSFDLISNNNDLSKQEDKKSFYDSAAKCLTQEWTYSDRRYKKLGIKGSVTSCGKGADEGYWYCIVDFGKNKHPGGNAGFILDARQCFNHSDNGKNKNKK